MVHRKRWPCCLQFNRLGRPPAAHAIAGAVVALAIAIGAAALVGCVSTYATSSKLGMYRRQVAITPAVAGEEVVTAAQAGPVALVFGREDRGLSSAELRHCDLRITIPSSESYASWNLSHAVAIVAAENHEIARQALDLIEEKLGKIRQDYGPESVIFSMGTGRDIGAWICMLAYAYGSPNVMFALSGIACYSPRIAGVETMQGEIAAYIPTNLISITDGQIYLDRDLFVGGFRPAVNIARSVSRIGGQAQHPRIKEEAGRMKLDYLQFLELEMFTRFGAKLEASMEAAIQKGRLLREILKQERLIPQSINFQMAWLVAFNDGLLQDDELDHIPARLRTLQDQLKHSALTIDSPRQHWAEEVSRWLKMPARKNPA